MGATSTVPFPLPLGAIPLSTPRQERDSSLLNTALLPAEALSSWLLSKSSMSPWMECRRLQQTDQHSKHPQSETPELPA